jgi:hypothetical protein
MPTKRGRSNSPQSNPRTVYVVLKRSSVYRPRGDEHEVSCESVHTTLTAANKAARLIFEIDEDEDVAEEDGWSSWEDLDGTRVQTDSEGKVRVIQVFDTQGEDLAWVEKKTIDEGDETEESEDDEEEDDMEERQAKRLKVDFLFSVGHSLMSDLGGGKLVELGDRSNRRLIASISTIYAGVTCQSANGSATRPWSHVGDASAYY